MRIVVVYNGEKENYKQFVGSEESNLEVSLYLHPIFPKAPILTYRCFQCNQIITNLQFMKNLENKMLISESKIVR